MFFSTFPSQKLLLPGLLRAWESVSYVLLKVDSPYTPEKFPQAYPIGKDLDVLVSEADFEKALLLLEQFQKETKWMYGTILQRSPKRVKVRFMWLGVLHYQIDLAHDLELGGLERELLASRKKKNSFYQPGLSVELLYRACEYRVNPKKKHHAEFIHKHGDQWDVSLATRYNISMPLSEDNR